MFERYKKMFPNAIRKTDYGDEFIIQLNKNKSISGINQICIRSANPMQDLVFIPTFRKRFGSEFEKEMYLIAKLLGFDEDVIPNDYSYSIMNYSNVNKVFKNNQTMPYNKSLISNLSIYDLGELYAIGCYVDKNCTQDDIQYLFDNIDAISDIFKNCFIELGWGEE